MIENSSKFSSPLVSVVILSYNQKRFLYEAIESVLRQSYSPKQIVIADDASTDGSHQLISQYCSKYPGVFSVHLGKFNRGITANSNEALALCKGKYIAWLGGDDIMYPDRIKAQVDMLERDESVCLVYSTLDLIDENGSPLNSTVPTTGRSTNNLSESLRDLTHGGNNIPAPSVMHRNTCLPAGGYDPLVPIASDWLFWIRLIVASQPNSKIAFIKQSLGAYRRHSANVTSSKVWPDAHLTAALLDFYYPDLAKYGRKARAAAFYQDAMRRQHTGGHFRLMVLVLRNDFGCLKYYLRLVQFVFRFFFSVEIDRRKN